MKKTPPVKGGEKTLAVPQVSASMVVAVTDAISIITMIISIPQTGPEGQRAPLVIVVRRSQKVTKLGPLTAAAERRTQKSQTTLGSLEKSAILLRRVRIWRALAPGVEGARNEADVGQGPRSCLKCVEVIE